MTGSVSLSALAVILAIGSLAAAQPQPPRPAMPIEPISAIVQQFKSHDSGEPIDAEKQNLLRVPRGSVCVAAAHSFG